MEDTPFGDGPAPDPTDYGSFEATRVGNYVIDKLTGIGGYGVVFKAHHEFLGTVAAIEISYPLTETTDDVKAVLGQGYRTLPNLTHPNICRVLDFGQLTHQGRDHFYVVVEYVDGQYLGHLPAPETKATVRHYIGLWTQVCNAIAYVHQYRYYNDLGFEVTGIYHGDIKPDNVVLDRRTGQPKIIDFLYLGFKLKADAAHSGPTLPDDADTNAIDGYMAPEQKRLGQVSARTEVYSLGATLYTLLTDRKTPLSVFRQGGAREQSQINPAVPMAVWTLISKATHDDPAQRYPSVMAMLADLPTPPLARLSQRNRWLTGSAVAGLILIGLIALRLEWSADNDIPAGKRSADLGNARGGVSESQTVARPNRPRTYHALLIAINDYRHDIQDLQQPVLDAQKLSEVLIRQYTFEPRYVHVVTNPTRRQLINEFDNLASQLTEDDNLLIFYAGHGLYDSKLQQGYWLPADAHRESRSEWIANNDIRDYINGIRTKHTLLISDACYSGSFLMFDRSVQSLTDAEPSVQENDRKTSRQAITSNTMEAVPDESVFARYLVEHLRSDTLSFLSATGLFASFARDVSNANPRQLPQFGRVKGRADEGGDFIFVKR